VNRTATSYTPRSSPATFDGFRGPVPTDPSGRGRDTPSGPSGYGTSPSPRGRGYTPPSSRGRGPTSTNLPPRGPALAGVRQRADSPSRHGTIRDVGGHRQRQPTPPRHGGVARQPSARQPPQLTLSAASDIGHSRDSTKDQDATRLQVPPRVSRAGHHRGNRSSGRNQDPTRPQRVSRSANPSGNPLIAEWNSVRSTQPVRPAQTAYPTQPRPTQAARPTQSRPTQPTRPTQPVRPAQPQSELEMSQHKVDFMWAAASRGDCDFLENCMLPKDYDGPAIARAKILTIDSALASSEASKVVTKMGPQWVIIHDHARWCFLLRAFAIAFNGGYEQTGKIAEMTAGFTEFGKLWQDARDAINEANVIIKAQHLIPASKKKWKDMNKLDVLEEALKRTEEAANNALVEERDAAAADAAVIAAEKEREYDLVAQLTEGMANMSIRVDTSIEQTVEHRHPNSADAQGYGTTTTISGPGVQSASRQVQLPPGSHLHITEGVQARPRARLHITRGPITHVDVPAFDIPAGIEATMAVELEGDYPPLTRPLVQQYLDALDKVSKNLRRGNHPLASSESDSSDTF
jgi:hypothetical protein